MLLAVGCASRPDAPPAGEFPSESLTVGRLKREYRLVVPESVDLRRPAPLVIAFHGMLLDSKDHMPKYSRLNQTARRHGFILAYPNAEGGIWGLWPDKIAADLAFFDALLTKLSSTYRIDPDRVYVLGMSNGGYFAHLLAKERSNVIAAVAAHSSALGLQTLWGVNAPRKFPVMIVHGAQDLIFAPWIARENADKYRREGHEVELVEVPRLGHFWATDANINERIWAFFARRPRGKRGQSNFPVTLSPRAERQRVTGKLLRPLF